MDPTLETTPEDAAAQADPDVAALAPRKQLGALLVEGGLIDAAQLAEALRDGASTGERLGEVVVRRRWASEDDVALAIALQWGLHYVDRASIWFDADALTRLSREDAQRVEALPTRVEDRRVVVAVAEPTEQRLAALEKLLGETVVVVVAKTALEAGLHSELLSSRKALDEPAQDDVAVHAPQGTETTPPALSGEGLADVAALAAQAHGLADLMAAQADALTNALPASGGRAAETEELEAARGRVEELEAELAAQRIAVDELKSHLEAGLKAIERSF